MPLSLIPLLFSVDAYAMDAHSKLDDFLKPHRVVSPHVEEEPEVSASASSAASAALPLSHLAVPLHVEEESEDTSHAGVASASSSTSAAPPLSPSGASAVDSSVDITNIMNPLSASKKKATPQKEESSKDKHEIANIKVDREQILCNILPPFKGKREIIGSVLWGEKKYSLDVTVNTLVASLPKLSLGHTYDYYHFQQDVTITPTHYHHWLFKDAHPEKYTLAWTLKTPEGEARTDKLLGSFWAVGFSPGSYQAEVDIEKKVGVELSLSGSKAGPEGGAKFSWEKTKKYHVGNYTVSGRDIREGVEWIVRLNKLPGDVLTKSGGLTLELSSLFCVDRTKAEAFKIYEDTSTPPPAGQPRGQQKKVARLSLQGSLQAEWSHLDIPMNISFEPVHVMVPYDVKPLGERDTIQFIHEAV